MTLSSLFQPSEPLQSDTCTNTHTEKFPLLFSVNSWEALSCSLKAIKVTCCQWRSRFHEIFKRSKYFTLFLFFLRPPTEIGSFRRSDATSLWMYLTGASITFSQANLVYVGMLLYDLAESSSKWPCRDSVLQVAKPFSPIPVIFSAFVSILAVFSLFGRQSGDSAKCWMTCQINTSSFPTNIW